MNEILFCLIDSMMAQENQGIITKGCKRTYRHQMMERECLYETCLKMINLTCLGKYLTLPDSGRDGEKRESVIWRMSGWEIRGGKGMVREKEEVDRGKVGKGGG